MPAVHHRASSTKGKHIHLSSPALAKGLACSTCKSRKVRCDGQKPSCSSCRRTARFEGRNEEEVVCCYEGKKCGTRKSRRPSAEQEEDQQSTPEQIATLPLVMPLPQPSAEPSLDSTMDFSNLAAKLLACNHLYTVDSNVSNLSAMSSDRPSSSTSSSFDLPASSTSYSASLLSQELLEASFFPTYCPSHAFSTSPLPILDASDYFAALQPASTASMSSFDSLDTPASTSYPSYDLSSLFLAAPVPPPTKAEPSYFDVPPPMEAQEWPENAQTSSEIVDPYAGPVIGGIPLTPGWSIDYSAFAGLTALF